MTWKRIEDGLPDIDCVCIGIHKMRAHKIYICYYSKHYKTFELNSINVSTNLYDPIPVKITHYIQVPSLPEGT